MENGKTCHSSQLPPLPCEANNYFSLIIWIKEVADVRVISCSASSTSRLAFEVLHNALICHPPVLRHPPTLCPCFYKIRISCHTTHNSLPIDFFPTHRNQEYATTQARHEYYDLEINELPYGYKLS